MEEFMPLSSSLERELLTLQKLNNFEEEETRNFEQCFPYWDDQLIGGLDNDLLDRNLYDYLSQTSSNSGSFIDTQDAFSGASAEELLASISSHSLNSWDSSSSPLSSPSVSEEEYSTQWTPNNDFVALGVSLKTLSSDSDYSEKDLTRISTKSAVHNCHNNSFVSTNYCQNNTTVKLPSLNPKYSALFMSINNNNSNNNRINTCLNNSIDNKRVYYKLNLIRS
jgi:hypothetical protein